MGKKTRVDTAKVEAALVRAGKDPAIAALAVAAFQYALTKGLREHFEAQQGKWARNSEEYLAWKRKRGYGQRAWEMTGKTLKAITNNAPEKLGTKKGMKVGVNWKNLWAYASPRAFVGKDGKKLPAERQDMIYHTLRNGSGRARLAEYARKKNKTVGEVIASVFAPKKAAKAVPPRPFLSWTPEMKQRLVDDLEKAIVEVLNREGLDTKEG
ncbi:hypothetical protein GC173_08125 [bacterium]|nr:hypothetical protein [bacterium]